MGLEREIAPVSGVEGPLFPCISKQRASGGGHVESPTTDSLSVAWRTGTGTCWCPEQGHLFPEIRRDAAPWANSMQEADGNSVRVAELPSQGAKSSCRTGPQTLSGEVRSSHHTVCTEQAFSRLAEETSVSRDRKA